MALLELSREQMRAFGYRVVDLLVDHWAGLRDKAAGYKGSPAELRRIHSDPAPLEGTAPGELLDRLSRDVFARQLYLQHPRFFAFVPGPANFASVMGDALAAGFNTFSGSWMGGSAPAALELNVIDWIRGWCGFPETAGGLFVSGGSMANLTALAVARHAKLGDRISGAAVYLSDQTHSSVGKGLRILGFGADQIRVIPSGADFRISVEALWRQMMADREAGLRPFALIANAGTTNTGEVDPLRDLAAFCREHGLWMHVDGAYGAAAVISDRGRALLDGIGEADSLSLDPHKWLFQTIECGCVLVRDAALLRAAFDQRAEYLKLIHRDEEEVNFCDRGIQLTRGFRALKLWLSVQTFGLNAFRQAMDRGFQIAEEFERRLRELPEWEIVLPAQMAILCFRFRQGDDALHVRVADRMLADGFALVITTVLNGRTVLRVCTIHPNTTEEDIAGTVERLTRFAREEAHL